MVARAVNCNEFAGTQCEYEKLYCRAIHDRPYDINLMFIGLLDGCDGAYSARNASPGGKLSASEV